MQAQFRQALELIRRIVAQPGLAGPKRLVRRGRGSGQTAEDGVVAVDRIHVDSLERGHLDPAQADAWRGIAGAQEDQEVLIQLPQDQGLVIGHVHPSAADLHLGQQLEAIHAPDAEDTGDVQAAADALPLAQQQRVILRPDALVGGRRTAGQRGAHHALVTPARHPGEDTVARTSSAAGQLSLFGEIEPADQAGGKQRIHRRAPRGDEFGDDAQRVPIEHRRPPELTKDAAPTKGIRAFPQIEQVNGTAVGHEQQAAVIGRRHRRSAGPGFQGVAQRDAIARGFILQDIRKARGHRPAQFSDGLATAQQRRDEGPVVQKQQAVVRGIDTSARDRGLEQTGGGAAIVHRVGHGGDLRPGWQSDQTGDDAARLQRDVHRPGDRGEHRHVPAAGGASAQQAAFKQDLPRDTDRAKAWRAIGQVRAHGRVARLAQGFEQLAETKDVGGSGTTGQLVGRGVDARAAAVLKLCPDHHRVP